MKSRRASIQRQTLETTYINGIVDGMLSSQSLGTSMSSDYRDWSSELLVFSKYNCPLVITVLIERIEEQAQLMSTSEHVRQSLTICSTVYRMLSDKANMQQVTSTIAFDALNLLFRFRQVVWSNMPLDDNKVCDLLRMCCRLVCIFSAKFPDLALNVFWEHLKINLEQTDWDDGVFHVCEVLGYLSLNVTALAENLRRLQRLFQSYLKSINILSVSDVVESSSCLAIYNEASYKTEKQLKRLLQVISVPLRACIWRWMCAHPSQFAALFAESDVESASPIRSKRRSLSVDADELQNFAAKKSSLITPDVVRELLAKLEATAGGTSKKLFLWPTIIILACLLPQDTKRAIRSLLSDTKAVELMIVDKVFSATLSSLRPTVAQRLSNFTLFLENSLVSFLYLLHIDHLLRRYQEQFSDPGFLIIGTFVGPNLLKIKEMIMLWEYPSSQYLTRIEQHRSKLKAPYGTPEFTQKSLLESFLVTSSSIKSVFNSILAHAIANPIKVVLPIRSVIFQAILYLTSSVDQSHSLLLELSPYPSYFRRADNRVSMLWYALHMLLVDLGAFYCSIQINEDSVRALLVSLTESIDVAYIANLAKVTPQNNHRSSITVTNTSQVFVDAHIEYTLQYLKFIEIMAHEIFVDIDSQVDDVSSFHSVNNVYFSDMRIVYLTRIGLEILTLYQSKIEAVKVHAEDTIYALTSVSLFERFSSVSTISFFSYCLTLLNKSVRFLWGSVDTFGDDFSPRILRTIHAILKLINEFVFTSDLSGGFTTRVIYMCKVCITDLERVLIVFLAETDETVLSLVIDCLKELGGWIEHFDNLVNSMMIDGNFAGSAIRIHAVDGFSYETIFPIILNISCERKPLWSIYQAMMTRKEEILMSSYSSRDNIISSMLSEAICFSHGFLNGLAEMRRQWDRVSETLQSPDETVVNDKSLFLWINQTLIISKLGVVYTESAIDLNMEGYTSIFASEACHDFMAAYRLQNIDSVNNTEVVEAFLKTIVSIWFNQKSNQIFESGILYLGQFLHESFVQLFLNNVLLVELKISPVVLRNKGRLFTVDSKGYSTDDEYLYVGKKLGTVSLPKSLSVVGTLLLVLELLCERFSHRQNDPNFVLEVYEEILTIMMYFAEDICAQMDMSRVEDFLNGTTRNSDSSTGSHREDLSTVSLEECFSVKQKTANTLRVFISKCKITEISLRFRQSACSHLMNWLLDTLSNHYDYTHTLNGCELPSVLESCVRAISEKKNINYETLRSVELACVCAITPILKQTPLDNDIKILYTSGDISGVMKARDLDTFLTLGKIYEKDEFATKRSINFCLYLYCLSNLYMSCLSDKSEARLKQAVVEAVSNLLYANPSIGFKTLTNALERHVVDELRGLYLQALQKCMELDVSFGSSKEQRLENYRQALVDLQMFCYYDYFRESDKTKMVQLPVLVESLVMLADKDSDEIVISCFLTSYTQFGCFVLLKKIFMYELGRLDSLKTLFRTDNFCSRYSVAMLSSCGENYLQRTLSTVLTDVVFSVEDIEILPSKLNVTADLQELTIQDNILRLKVTVSNFLEAIVSSYKHCSLQMKQILQMLRHETRRRFGEDVSCDRASVGALLFLRFICPAVINPQNVHNLLPGAALKVLSESVAVKRKLLLIVKVLQQLANGALFVDEHMQAMNDWLSQHSSVIHEFYRRISSSEDDEDLNRTANDLDSNNDKTIWEDIYECKPEDICLPLLHLDSSVASSLINLHSVLKATEHKLGASIRKLSLNKFKTFGLLLKNLGEMSRISTQNDDREQTFSRKSAKDNLSALFKNVEDNGLDKFHSLKCVYGCTYLSSQQIPSACYIILRRTAGYTDPKIFLYDLFKTLTNLANCSKRMALVVDCSLFNKNNFLLNKSAKFWRMFFTYYVESNLIHSISSIYVLYPSSEAMKVGAIIYEGIIERLSLQDMDDILAKLLFISPHSMNSLDINLLKSLPQFTQNIERGLEIRWPAAIMSKPISVGFSDRVCSVEQYETVNFENGMAPIQFLKVDMMFIGAITNVSIESKSTAVSSMINASNGDHVDDLNDLTEFNTKSISRHRSMSIKAGNSKALAQQQSIIKSPSFEANQSKVETAVVAISYVVSESSVLNGFNFGDTPDSDDRRVVLRVYTSYGPQIESSYISVRSRYLREQAMQLALGNYTVGYTSPESVPGIILHGSLSGIFSANANTICSALSLLSTATKTFHLQQISPVLLRLSAPSASQIMPHVPINLLSQISSDLSVNRPEYAYEFFDAFVSDICAPEVSDSRKASVIKILRPWLKYLKYFDNSNPMSEVCANEKHMLTFLDRIEKKEIKNCRDSLTKLLKEVLYAFDSENALSVVYMTEFWPEISQDNYLARIALEFFIEEIVHIEIYSQQENDRIQQEDQFSVDFSDTHSAIIKIHGSNGGGQRERRMTDQAEYLSSQAKWGIRAKTDMIGEIITQELRFVQLKNINSLIHMFCEYQSSLVEEMLVDFVISSFTNLSQQKDTNDSDWFPVIACMKPLVSIPFQNFSFTENVLYKLCHLTVLTVTHEGPRRKVFCTMAHSMLLSVVNVCIVNAKHRLITTPDSTILEEQLLEFVNKAPLFSSTLEPNTFETLVEFMSKAIQSCGAEVYRTHRQRWFQISVDSMQNKSQLLMNTKFAVVVGVLLRPEDLSSSLTKRLLSVLKHSLSKTSVGLRYMCRFLIRFVEFLRIDELMRVFWISVMLVQIADEHCMQDSIELLGSVIGLIDRNMDEFQDSSSCPLVFFILKSRSLVDKILIPLERGPLGLRFDSPENFAISLSATMLRGANMPQNASMIYKILNTFVKEQMFNSLHLGFFPLLMMTSQGRSESEKLVSYLSLLDGIIVATQSNAIFDDSPRRRFDSFSSSVDSSGFHTAPSTPMQTQDDQSLRVISTPKDGSTKKKLFPETPQKPPGSPERSTKTSVSYSKENLVSLILFTSLLFAALKSSNDPHFLIQGYRILADRISSHPVVVKCLYGAIFPELIKKSSNIRQKDRTVLAVIQRVIERFTMVSSIDIVTSEDLPDAFDFLRESYGFGELLTCGNFSSHVSQQSELRSQILTSTIELVKLFVQEFTSC